MTRLSDSNRRAELRAVRAAGLLGPATSATIELAWQLVMRSRQANARAQALDANGEVPCTCADIRHAAYRTGDVPSAALLGWHYDACQRTIAALTETVQ